MQNPKCIKQGFTLIELLVVIAIISLLTTILLPSLKRAKELAQEVGCLANMKSYGLALHMYLNDSEGVFPYFIENINEQTKFETHWYNRLGDYIGLAEYKQGDDYAINMYRAKSRQCLSDPDVIIGVNYGAYVNPSTPTTYRGPFVYKIVGNASYPDVTIEGIDMPSQWVAFADSYKNHYFMSPSHWQFNTDYDGDGNPDSNSSVMSTFSGSYNGAAAKAHHDGMNSVCSDGSGKKLDFEDDWQDPDLTYWIDQ